LKRKPPKSAAQRGGKCSRGFPRTTLCVRSRAERDERIPLDSATRAAAHYLRDLNRRFGDWPLALAAYNAGQKAVEDALEKGRATTFWQLSSAGLLPRETQTYVPAVLSAMQLLGSKPPADIRIQPHRENWVYASAIRGY
jgi:soluble lytic murein transglycosylase-like protein